VIAWAFLFCASRIVVTEVMANPKGTSGAHFPEDRNEFVELYNPGPEAIDLFDWRLDDGDAQDRLVAWQDTSILISSPNVIIQSTWLLPGRYAVALDSEYTDPIPEGGFVQPYRFGDSCLVLTVKNTTLGDGLTTNDPVTISSNYGDSSTFGTPLLPDDGFPDNPGDGISWERINPAEDDFPGNWAPCPAEAGSTPGDTNGVSSVPDLAVTRLELANPGALRPAEPFLCRATVANAAYAGTREWRLDVFVDANANGRPDQTEPKTSFDGWVLAASRDSTVETSLLCPQVTTDLWALVTCALEQDTTNNRQRVTLSPGGASRALNLVTSGFSPNGDGFEDSLEIVFRLPAATGRLSVTVFDLGGRKVRSLFSASPPDRQGSLYWDGRTDSGAWARTGVYAVWLNYHNPDTDLTEKLPAILRR